MKILDRYTARGVYQWTGLALVVLVSLLIFQTFVDESDDTGVGNFQILQALQVTLLKTPGFIVEVFPISALLGGLLALGSLARHAELTAMRTAGMSLWRILGSVMLAGLGLAVTVALISEFVVPAAEQRAELFKADRLGQQSILHTRHGYWLRDGNSFVNVREVRPGPSLGGVFIYELDDTWQLTAFHYASLGDYHDGKWILRDVDHARLTPRSVETSSEKEWLSPLTVKPAFLELVAIKPRVMSVRDLYQYLSFLSENGQSSPEYEVALWNKITVPVATLVLLILAVASVLANPRSADIGGRVLAGAVAGAVFVLLTRAASFTALVYDVPPALAAWLPLVVFSVVGLVYLNRLK